MLEASPRARAETEVGAFAAQASAASEPKGVGWSLLLLLLEVRLAAVQSFLAHLVIHAAPLRVLQHFISGAELLKLSLSTFRLVLVWMVD
jgi:hypothetical protein